MAWLSLEELKKYDAKKELKKMGQAEKSAASLRSGGQPVEVVRDTGAKDAVKNLLEKHKKSRAIRKEMQSIGQDLRKNKSTDLAAYRRVAPVSYTHLDVYKRQRGRLPSRRTNGIPWR